MDRTYIQRNAETRQKPRDLVGNLDAAPLTWAMDNDWTIAAVLAHLADWDESNLVRWRRYREPGGIAAVSSMATIDMITDAALPAQRALDPHAAVALALETAEACDRYVEELPDDLVAFALSENRTNYVDRAIRRNQHIPDIERVPGEWS
jgi:hypothetical protein